MDNRGQVLYGAGKCLIHKEKHQTAHFLGNTGYTLSRLSLSVLDNHVDNLEQVLYDDAKCLIGKAYPWIAQKIGAGGRVHAQWRECSREELSEPGYPAPHGTILWTTLDKPCMATLSH